MQHPGSRNIFRHILEMDRMEGNNCPLAQSQARADHVPPVCSSREDVLKHITMVLDVLTTPAERQWNEIPIPPRMSRAERRAHVQAVLDANPPILPVTVACLTCKSCWFCTCPFIGPRRPRKRSRSPMPSTPLPQGMEEVLRITRGCKTEQQASSTQEQQRQAAIGQKAPSSSTDAHGQQAAIGQQASSTQEQQRQAAKGQGHGPLTPCSHGQQDWNSIKARLPDKTLRLERTEPMFKELLDDGRPHITVNLAPNTDYILHCGSVVAELPSTHRFKFGITVNPHQRWYEARYAYSNARSMQRDGVEYNEMVVVFAHHSRDVVAMQEHCLIDKFRKNSRCVNRKRDFDNHIRNDDSDSDDTRSEGPHVLYICHGEALGTGFGGHRLEFSVG